MFLSAVHPALAGTLETIIHASDMQQSDVFGSSVAISGNTMVVGAELEDGGAGDPVMDCGAVYIYERSSSGSTTWEQKKILYASNRETSDAFGQAVAINGDTIVVGARMEGGGDNNPLPGSGAAYIYERNLGGANNWGQAKIIRASDAAMNSMFGHSVAIHVDRVVVGALLMDGVFSDSGAAYLYERNEGGPNNWGQVKILKPSDAVSEGQFGSSVAIEGDTIVVGSRQEKSFFGSNPNPAPGAVYIYERDFTTPNSWGEAKIIHASNGEDGDQFGISVGISGDRVVVGAKQEAGGDGNPLNSAGAAYIYERNLGGPNNWGQAKILRASNAGAGDQRRDSDCECLWRGWRKRGPRFRCRCSLCVSAKLRRGEQLGRGKHPPCIRSASVRYLCLVSCDQWGHHVCGCKN